MGPHYNGDLANKCLFNSESITFLFLFGFSLSFITHSLYYNDNSNFTRELLLAILNNIHTVAHLTQCRLINVQWNDAATQSMFGKKTTTETEEQAIKLYRHLFRDIS